MKQAIKKVNLTSANINLEQMQQLRHILPEAFSEEKIDWDKLRAILGNAVDQQTEKFGFKWAGKSSAIKNVLIPSVATLAPANNESIKFEESQNLFIEGDNLEVLKLLQKAYFEKVKMIYIDPPYNTGGDFVYHDDFTAPVKSYLQQTGQIDDAGNKLQSNNETNGRYHSDWLTMMYPRLKLAWNLMRDDGVIFVSIDDNEAHHLRMLMDEVFGEENFIADVAVVNNLKGRNDKRYIATANERLLMYVKSDIFEETGLQLPVERMGEFDQEDEIGKYRFLGLRKRGGADTREKRPKLFFPLYVNPKNGNVSVEKNSAFSIEVLPKKSDGVEGAWRWGFTTVKIRIGSLVGKPVGNQGKYDVFEKDYLETDGEIRRIKPKSVMSGSNYSTDSATKAFKTLFPEIDFQNPKPVPFIQDLISYSTLPNEGDIILDFFAGSGTTAHAMFEQNKKDGGNRKFILVQLPEKLEASDKGFKAGYHTIADITKERIRRVVTGYGETPQPLADGFKVFTLTKSNYPENNFEFDPEKSEAENKQAFDIYLAQAKQSTLLDVTNNLDVVYENIIKEGFSLNAKVDTAQIGKNKVFTIKDGEREFFVCLDKKLDAQTAKELTGQQYKDKLFICLDTALDDTGKANVGLNVELKTL